MARLSAFDPFLSEGTMETIECCIKFCIPVFVMILEQSNNLFTIFLPILKLSCHSPCIQMFTAKHWISKVLTLHAKVNVITSKMKHYSVENACVNVKWQLGFKVRNKSRLETLYRSILRVGNRFRMSTTGRVQGVFCVWN